MGLDNEGQIPGGKLISLDGMIFGMPPSTHVSDKLMLNSMPTATIIPCEPNFTLGLSLFRLNQEAGMKEYVSILESVGYTMTGNSIKVAYLADNFPTDTFNNEYGETFLDRFAQATSSGFGDFAQIAGWTNSDQAISQSKKMLSAISEGGGAMGAMFGDAVSGAMGAGEEAIKGVAGALGDQGKANLNSVLKTAKSLLTGSRVDFPLVWKNSNFNPSYTMTIRLYNPDPSSEESTRKYIVGPIAALVALGVPKVAEDSVTYKWPLLCKVRSPGIYHLNAAYINSISVIKGGDQQSIAFNQTMAMCDVRIDFGCLYNSILAGAGSNKFGYDRPTLGTYLEAIGGSSYTGGDRRRDTYKMNTKENKLEKLKDYQEQDTKYGSPQQSQYNAEIQDRAEQKAMEEKLKVDNERLYAGFDF